MSSLTLATFFFLRHLPDASGRGIGKPLRTTNRSRLVFRYTSNILQAPSRRQNIAGSRNGNNPPGHDGGKPLQIAVEDVPGKTEATTRQNHLFAQVLGHR
jgi:hypothetical protein